MRDRPRRGLAVLCLATACLLACERQAESSPEPSRLDPERRRQIVAEMATAPILATPNDDPSSAEPGLDDQAISGAVDTNITATPNESEAEVTLALDRHRPRRVLAVTMTMPSFELLSLASEDGGRTFRRARIGPPAGGSTMADPWVRFDTQGVAHLAFLTQVMGRGVQVAVSRSTDGLGWSTPRLLGLADKPALVVDDELDSPFRDSIYVVWVVPLETIWIARSTDGGVTFEGIRSFEANDVGGPDAAVAADGTLYVAARDLSAGRIYVWRSTDGGATFTRATAAPLRGWIDVANPADCQRRARIQMSLTVDRSPGLRRGTVYLTWPDYPPGLDRTICGGDRCDPATPCAPDVYTTRSEDGGRSWSPPRRVHPAGVGNDQFHAWSALDPIDGTLHVSYLDTRDAADRRSTHVWLTSSRDGGRSFTTPRRLSTAPSRSRSSFGYGDYRGMVAHDDQIIAVWSDFRADQHRGEIYLRRLAASDPSPDDCAFLPGAGPFCDRCGPCAAGLGDCDDDQECQTGLVCVEDVGADHGFAPGVDVCQPVDDGPAGCPWPVGAPRYCVDCGPCTVGEGDCDRDAECVSGTRCIDNVGASFGFPAGIDICLAESPTGPDSCPWPAGHPRRCTDCGPCGRGEGDCDGDQECVTGARCIEDAGPTFGYGSRVDVCQ